MADRPRLATIEIVFFLAAIFFAALKELVDCACACRALRWQLTTHVLRLQTASCLPSSASASLAYSGVCCS